MKRNADKLIYALIFLSLVGIISSCGNTVVNDEDAKVELKIDSLIEAMTLEEKIAMIHANSSFTSAGVERLGIPELVMSDGPHGVRPEHGRDWELDNDVSDSATYLPTGITLAATWNPDLGYEFGKVLGSEAKYRGKDIILGPGVNIIRSPLNGRNFEYLSEGIPYLSSVMAVGYVKGVQDQGVAACVKHFVANNQEQFRDRVNVKMSERALREIYLPAFKAAVTEGNALSVMGAYNRFRGEFCTHNDYLVNQVLKKEWGFSGVLMSDWNAVHDTREALLKGTDLEMGTDLGMLPDPDYNKFYLADSALAMIKKGEVEEKYVNDKVRRILRLMFAVNKFGKRTPGAFNTANHQQTALKVAEEGIVLLKNEEILPLNTEKVKTIAVIGDNAIRKHSMGGGSSQVRAKYEITFLEALKKAVGDKATIDFAPGYKVDTMHYLDPKHLKDAEVAAEKADVVIFVGGWVHAWDESGIWGQNVYDAKAIDKPNMTMPFAQDELIQKLVATNPNTVVVLYGGGPVDMTQWVDKVKGIVQAWYPGMEGGTAITNVLCGKVNPSGKLPIAFPKKLEDSPAHTLGEYPGINDEVNYNEDIFVGYRYFDSYQVEPQYSFGHGLSYTSFAYKDIKATVDGENVKLSFTITNSGQRSGAEVAQVYVHDMDATVKRPEKELKGFQKAFLAPGESKLIEIELGSDAFSFYDEAKKEWKLEPGKFKISIGSSSTDLRLTSEVEIN